jgi:hypothetical protein
MPHLRERAFHLPYKLVSSVAIQKLLTLSWQARNARPVRFFYVYDRGKGPSRRVCTRAPGIVRRRVQAWRSEENSKAEQEKLVMYMKVSHNQFEADGDKLRHTPTGVLLRLSENDVVSCELGLGGTRTGAGDDYDVEQLKQAAWEIFKLQKNASL